MKKDINTTALKSKRETPIWRFLFNIYSGFKNYSRFLIALVASSKPGFSSNANIFFL